MNYFRLIVIYFVTQFFILLVNVNSAKAQPVKVGITGGIDVSSHLNEFWIRDEKSGIPIGFKPKITTGYQAGIIVRKDFSALLRLQTEPSVTLLGARYEESFSIRNLDLQTKSRTKLLYLQLPLVLQLSTIPKSRTVYGIDFPTTTYHLTGGFFGGYLLDARFSGTNSGMLSDVSLKGTFSEDVASHYSDYDGGVILGGGLEYGNKKKIGFETRALFSVFNTGNSSDLYWFRPQNMALTFSVYLLL